MIKLLDEEIAEDLKKLRKNQIGEVLNLTEMEVNKAKKDKLLSILFNEILHNELLIKLIYKKFATELGLHPCRVEEHLKISKAERLRWTEQNKLLVVGYSSFKKWGKNLDYPIYDAYQIKSVSENEIEKWRLQHKQKIEQGRKQASQKAKSTRMINKRIHRDFYETEWKAMLKEWFITDGKLGATLQLAFWTMWISRWAKEFQLNAKNARKHTEEYQQKKQLFYLMKNKAVQLLIHSPYTKISFFQPDDSDKITYLNFCPKHYQLWSLEREFDYVTNWDFYYSYIKDIHRCSLCEVHIQKDYYSLFYISIQHNDYHFSFHTPHPIGEAYFPPKDSLPKISHQEQEGMFRFGRTLFDDEKIIFKEKEVIQQFNEAVVKFNLYFRGD